MVRGIYAAAGAMLSVEEQTATTANNLANVDTAGFKSDLLRFTSMPGIHTWRVDDPSTRDRAGKPQPEYIGLTPAGIADTEIWRDFSGGQVVESGNPLDVAIIGDGFLRLSDGQGGELYSRSGQLKRGLDGFLVDNFGRRVQGSDGDIFLGDSTGLAINESGEITSGPETIATLELAYFDDPQGQLRKQGDGVWIAEAGASRTGAGRLQGGALERSNVEVVSSIAEMILQLRHYEANQKVISTTDATLEIAVNQLGRMPG